MTLDDLRRMRAPLALLVATAVLAAVVAHPLHRDLRSAEQRLQQERSRLQAAAAQLRRHGEEQALVARYRERYRELERSGFMAAEQRARWISALRAANEAARLFGIEYRIEPQRPYAAARPLDTPALVVLESRMHLNAALLHEGDLQVLFDALAAQRAGLFVLERCALKRASDADAQSVRPQLSAECELAWLTARLRGAEDRR